MSFNGKYSEMETDSPTGWIFPWKCLPYSLMKCFNQVSALVTEKKYSVLFIGVVIATYHKICESILENKIM
jgi:hypothetical protein